MDVDGMMAKLEAIKAEHSHRVPDAAAQALLGEFRQRCLDLAVWVEVNMPGVRARAVCQTKLDEVRMWGCNAIVAGGEVRGELKINWTLPLEPTAE